MLRVTINDFLNLIDLILNGFFLFIQRIDLIIDLLDTNIFLLLFEILTSLFNVCRICAIYKATITRICILRTLMLSLSKVVLCLLKIKVSLSRLRGILYSRNFLVLRSNNLLNGVLFLVLCLDLLIQLFLKLFISLNLSIKRAKLKLVGTICSIFLLLQCIDCTVHLVLKLLNPIGNNRRTGLQQVLICRLSLLCKLLLSIGVFFCVRVYVAIEVLVEAAKIIKILALSNLTI